MTTSRLGKRRIFSAIESLENRRMLASVSVGGGTLKIEKQTGILTVTATGNNQYQVQDGATNHGVFNAANGIEIKGTKNNDLIGVNMNGFTNSSFLKITGSDGDDLISVDGGAGGVILGEVSIDSGNGDDSVFISFNPGSLTLGNKLKLNDPSGSDQVDLGNGAGATQVLGNTEIKGYGVVNLGDGSFDNFGGDVNISVDSAHSVLHVNQGIPGGNEIMTIAGNLTIKGGSVEDTVFLRGMIVAGDLKADLGNSDTFNQFVVSSSAGSQTVVNGNLTYEGGKAQDFVDLGSVAVNGNVTVNLKEADDSLNLADFAASTFIGGNLKVNAGNGDDAIGNIDAQILGDVDLEMGDGNHDVTFTSSSFIGGKLHYHGHNGIDNLTLEAAQTYLLDAKFGSGDDSLTLDNAGATLTGKADGESGVDTFNLIAGTVDPTFQLISFP